MSLEDVLVAAAVTVTVEPAADSSLDVSSDVAVTLESVVAFRGPRNVGVPSVEKLKPSAFEQQLCVRESPMKPQHARDWSCGV